MGLWITATHYHSLPSTSSLLPDFPLVWSLVCVLFTTGRMRQSLQPIQVAQVIQLLQNGTSIYGITKKVCSGTQRSYRLYSVMITNRKFTALGHDKLKTFCNFQLCRINHLTGCMYISHLVHIVLTPS